MKQEQEKQPVILVIDDDYKAISSIYQNVHYPIYPYEENKVNEWRNKLVNYRSIVAQIDEFINNNYESLRCIICDLKLVEEKAEELEDYNGSDLINEIRNIIRIKGYPFYNRLIPIIAYTQLPDAKKKAEALENGANIVLDKSVHPKFLRAVINKQIEDFKLICNEFVLSKPYKVSITFNGNDSRIFVSKVAQILAMEYSKGKVFYDEYHRTKIYALSADEILQKIYCEQSEYVIPVFSENYESGKWSGDIEWSAIKDKLIPTHKKHIIPVLYDDANIDGLDLNHDIVIKVSNKPPKSNLTPEEVAGDIINKITYLENELS